MLQAVLRKLGVHDAIYDETYYERDVEGPAAQAAPHIARSIVDLYHPKSLLDVGCGTGAMMAAFRDLGVAVSGLEYSSAGIRRCQERGLRVLKFNIERDNGPYACSDIALSLEVAEHLPAKAAGRYIALLCKAAPVVIMSAARPGQDGTDHVNLQPQSYWIEKFARVGRNFDQTARDTLANEWRKAEVAGFYSDNLMVFTT